MRKTIVIYMVIALFSLVFVSAVAADDSSTGDVQLVSVVTSVNNESGGGGSAAVIQRLETTFNVTADQISALQADGLGYGEIAIVFSLASNMNGGITSANIQTIMNDRQSSPPMGWGQIARSLGLNLGKVVSAAESVKGTSQSASESSNAGSQGGISSNGHMSSAGAAGYGGRGGR